MKQVEKNSLHGMKITILALALNMIAFTILLVLNLIEKSIFKIFVTYGVIIYGFSVSIILIYLALKIKIPK